MKKLIKSVLRLVTVIVVVLVIGVIVIDLFADDAVRKAVESAASEELEVDVRMEKTRLSILGGSLSLHNVIVGNPPGYQTERLLVLDRGDIEVNARSLLSDEVHIKNITLSGMDVLIEQKGLGSNLHEVLQTLAEDEHSGKQLYVEKLEIKDVTVRVKLVAIPGQVDVAPLKLAPIIMTDLGRDEKMDTAALVGKIVLAVAGGIAEQGAGILPKEMIDGLGSVLDTVVDLGKIILGTGAEGVPDIGRGITESLKDLLKPKDEQ